jgi:hypothetical protein
MVDETNDPIAAAGEVILEALGGRFNPQNADQLTGNTGIERDLIVVACMRLKREGRIRIGGSGPYALYVRPESDSLGGRGRAASSS